MEVIIYFIFIRPTRPGFVNQTIVAKSFKNLEIIDLELFRLLYTMYNNGWYLFYTIFSILKVHKQISRQ